jgi:hypothetical protein
MATSSDTQKLIEATERNTNAVRALGFFFVGYFYQKLLGVILLGVGFVLLGIPTAANIWAIPAVAGAALLLVFGFLSISIALTELKASAKS